MRTGFIGPVPVQAHFLKVWDCRLIDSAAGAVGRTSGSCSFFVAINSSMWRSAPRRDCLCRRVDGSNSYAGAILPRKYPRIPQFGGGSWGRVLNACSELLRRLVVAPKPYQKLPHWQKYPSVFLSVLCEAQPLIQICLLAVLGGRVDLNSSLE